MAITSSDIAALPTYTDTELLKLYRWALANGAAGTERSIAGRAIKFPDVETIFATIERLEQRIAETANTEGAGIVLGEFGDAA